MMKMVSVLIIIIMLLNIIIEPGAIVEQHHLLEAVAGFKRVDGHGDVFQHSFGFLLFEFLFLVGDNRVVLNGWLINNDSVVYHKSILKPLEKPLVFLRISGYGN